MTTGKVSGFTVIELMLFLGVTGALFASLMIGVNSSISQQRYRDSVMSLSSFMQNQYNEVLNTRNERGDDWKCAGDGSVAQDPTGGSARGTSDCVILGRAIQVVDGGSAIRSVGVIGKEPSSQDSTGDIAALIAYKPKLAPYDDVTDSLEWGSHLVATNKQPSEASILILRSPMTGLLRIFTSQSPLPADITSVITPAAAETVLKNCVRGDSGLLPIQSVTIDPRISGLEGVTVNGVDPACD